MGANEFFERLWDLIRPLIKEILDALREVVERAVLAIIYLPRVTVEGAYADLISYFLRISMLTRAIGMLFFILTNIFSPARLLENAIRHSARILSRTLLVLALYALFSSPLAAAHAHQPPDLPATLALASIAVFSLALARILEINFISPLRLADVLAAAFIINSLVALALSGLHDIERLVPLAASTIYLILRHEEVFRWGFGSSSRAPGRSLRRRSPRLSSSF